MSRALLSLVLLVVTFAQCSAATPYEANSWGAPVVRAQSPESIWSPDSELMKIEGYRQLADRYRTTTDELHSLRAMVDEEKMFDDNGHFQFASWATRC